MSRCVYHATIVELYYTTTTTTIVQLLLIFVKVCLRIAYQRLQRLFVCVRVHFCLLFVLSARWSHSDFAHIDLVWSCFFTLIHYAYCGQILLKVRCTELG